MWFIYVPFTVSTSVRSPTGSSFPPGYCSLPCLVQKANLIKPLALFFLKNKFIYLFINLCILAALGLRCCAQAFSSCGEWGLLFVVVRGLLIAVTSLVAEHGL